MSYRLFALLGLCAGLAACGDSVPEQAVLGGAAGTLGAVALDSNPLVGAAIGAAGNTLYCQKYPSKCR
ncbi:MAG: hypothetical protein ACWA5A_01285 [Marinibacterium sp.]